MVTTVTTTTTTTVAAMAAASLVLIAIVTLIVLLIQKEIAEGVDDSRARRLSRILNVAIVPLLVVFLAAVITTVIDVLL